MNIEKKDIWFIVNPFSGTGKKGKILSLINEKLDTTKYHPSIRFTEYAGHGALLASEGVDKQIPIIVAVGGDGTVNEVAKSLKNSNTALGIIPGGSGNGFFMHLGIGRNPLKALDAINHGKIIKVDTCMMNEHFFLNVAGLGFDAQIAFLTKNNKRRGFLNYFTTSIKESRGFKPKEICLEIDGKKVEGKYVAAVAANASMYGYNFTIAPSAALDDGVLDIMLIKEAPVYRYFLSAYRFLNKSLHKSSLTETHQARSIKMCTPEPIFYHVDGEGFEAITDFNVSIVPKSLNVLAPIHFPVTK